jgi:hypothetical protein
MQEYYKLRLFSFILLFQYIKFTICCFYSVEREASKNIEENERECFKDAIVSSRSLNKGYAEATRLKYAIPEVNMSTILKL